MRAGRWVWVLAVWVLPVQGAERVCAVGERLYQEARDALAAGNPEGALSRLQRATEACPSYRYWQQRGRVAAELADHRDAAGAYVQAYRLAADPAQEAHTVASYAELLYELGDVQRALVYVHHARNVQPGERWIEALAETIDASARQVQRQHITRGLGDALVEPLVLNAAAGTVSAATAATAPAAAGAMLNIPVNFLFDSTEVDESTRANVAVLAEALASAAYAEQTFVFVGHADRRGSHPYNMRLSTDRANAIFEHVIGLQPSLTGRIRVEGRGEDEPLALGDSETDHRANRRLQVLRQSAH